MMRAEEASVPHVPLPTQAAAQPRSSSTSSPTLPARRVMSRSARRDDDDEDVALGSRPRTRMTRKQERICSIVQFFGCSIAAVTALLWLPTSELRIAIQHHQHSFPLAFLGLVLATFILYLLTMFSRPGYVDFLPPHDDQQRQQRQQQRARARGLDHPTVRSGTERAARGGGATPARPPPPSRHESSESSERASLLGPPATDLSFPSAPPSVAGGTNAPRLTSDDNSNTAAATHLDTALSLNAHSDDAVIIAIGAAAAPQRDYENDHKQHLLSDSAEHAPASRTDTLNAPQTGARSDDDLDRNGTHPYCKACKFLRPLRAKHCYQCGRCVIRFDHHCPFFGTCIGIRNHRLFWSYLTLEMGAIYWALDIAISSFSGDVGLTGALFRIGLCLCLGSLLLLAISLWAFHSYLAITNQTTWDMIKKDREMLHHSANQRGGAGGGGGGRRGMDSSYNSESDSVPRPIDSSAALQRQSSQEAAAVAVASSTLPPPPMFNSSVWTNAEFNRGWPRNLYSFFFASISSEFSTALEAPASLIQQRDEAPSQGAAQRAPGQQPSVRLSSYYRSLELSSTEPIRALPATARAHDSSELRLPPVGSASISGSSESVGVMHSESQPESEVLPKLRVIVENRPG